MEQGTSITRISGRLQFLDAAKGLCMLTILAGHVGMQWLPSSLFAVRLIIFFVISGILCSFDRPASEFVSRKARRLLVPLIIYYLISYAIFYVARLFVPGFETMTKAKGLLDIFTNKSLFNGPLWFLPVLFFVSVISYFIHKAIPSEAGRAPAHLVPGIIGFILSSKEINLPLFLDSTMTAMPFFYLGTLLSKVDFEKIGEKHDLHLLAILAVSLLAYYLFPFYADMAVNRYDCSLIRLFCIGAVTCTGLLALCMLISKYIPVLGKMLAFVGYHSLFLLCTQHLVYRFFEYILIGRLSGGPLHAVVFFCTTAICLFAAPIVEKYLPPLAGKVSSK